LQNSERNSSHAAYHGFEFTQNKLVLRGNAPLMRLNHAVLGLSGPPVLQETAEACFKEGSIAYILSLTQIVCVSGIVSCQMNGNVKHDTGHAAYKKALRKLKSPHYNSFISRIKRKFIALFSAGISSK
jgi:hypothetical protein